MPEVLYRKWRPGSLSDLVGQEYVSQTLKQAVSLDRFAHAYIFCGPRGTGKTSTARILAKAVNCLNPIGGEPDNSCNVCNSMNEGRAIDLIEIDAASNRRIADIRDLTEKIHYGPAECKYKVYIIDEVHMLTQEAFNALLKTLEEPPSHAILILATTDIHKVPPTIISRCQRFDFRRIPSEFVIEKLSDICKSEEVQVEVEALALIARKSTGSLRDAENILDQAITSFDQPITNSDVEEMLGIGDEFVSIELLSSVAKKDMNESLSRLAGLVADGIEPYQVLNSLVGLSRDLMVMRSGAGEGLDLDTAIKDHLNQISRQIDIGTSISMLKTFSSINLNTVIPPLLAMEVAIAELTLPETIGTDGSEQLTDSAPNSRGKVETHQIPKQPTNGNIAAPRVSTNRQSEPVNGSQTVRGVKSTASQESLTNEGATAEIKSTPTVRDGESGNLDVKWNVLLRSLRQTGKRFNLGALLRGCHGRDIRSDSLVLTFLHNSHLERINSELDDAVVKGELERIVEEVLGKRYDVRAELIASESGSIGKPAAQRSHLVRAAQSLGARIVEEKGRNRDE